MSLPDTMLLPRLYLSLETPSADDPVDEADIIVVLNSVLGNFGMNATLAGDIFSMDRSLAEVTRCGSKLRPFMIR